jgi:hypothetical protein
MTTITTNAGEKAAETGMSQPVRYLTTGRDLVIPFDSDAKYHWWRGGQSVKQTMDEVQTRMAVEQQQSPVAASNGAAACKSAAGRQE